MQLKITEQPVMFTNHVSIKKCRSVQVLFLLKNKSQISKHCWMSEALWKRHEWILRRCFFSRMFCEWGPLCYLASERGTYEENRASLSRLPHILYDKHPWDIKITGYYDVPYKKALMHNIFLGDNMMTFSPAISKETKDTV